MTNELLQNLIRLKYKTLVGDPNSIPTEYDNALLSDEDKEAAKWAWIRLAIKMGDCVKVTTGGGSAGDRHRQSGMMIAMIFQPANDGNMIVWRIADLLRTAFMNKTYAASDNSGSVNFLEPSFAEVGLATTKEWQLNMNLPFYSDHIG